MAKNFSSHFSLTLSCKFLQTLMNVKIVIVSKNVSIILEDTAAHVIVDTEETQTIQKDVMVSNKEHR